MKEKRIVVIFDYKKGDFFCFEMQAFGWAYLNNRHDTWEQLYVYWISPFVGAILAAWLFRIIFPPPPPAPAKQKKA